MTKKQNKHQYLTPKVSVVSFKIEDGFASIGVDTVTAVTALDGANVTTYDLNSGFSSAFSTGGTDNSHF